MSLIGREKLFYHFLKMQKGGIHIYRMGETNRGQFPVIVWLCFGHTTEEISLATFLTSIFKDEFLFKLKSAIVLAERTQAEEKQLLCRAIFVFFFFVMRSKLFKKSSSIYRRHKLSKLFKKKFQTIYVRQCRFD